MNDIPFPGDWIKRGNCTGRHDTFFPADNATKATREAATSRALKLCAGCPVVDECLDYAYRNELFANHDGVYGGETPQTRRNNRLRDAAAARKPKAERRTTPPPCGTYAAFSWHRKRGEPIDEACRLARNDQDKSNRKKRAA